MSGHQSPHRGATDVWLTPPEIIDALGPFDLDPCAAKDAPWPTADRHFTEADDGLAQEWAGFVWCNPPYGPDWWAWLRKLGDHGNGIGLIFARTETRGPHIYEIRSDWQTAALLRENGSRAETRADRSLVLLDPDIGPRAESLLHELLHCAWNLTSLRVTDALDEHEEAVVTSLAPLMLGMLRDNPDLVRFLVNDRRTEEQAHG